MCCPFYEFALYSPIHWSNVKMSRNGNWHKYVCIIHMHYTCPVYGCVVSRIEYTCTDRIADAYCKYRIPGMSSRVLQCVAMCCNTLQHRVPSHFMSMYDYVIKTVSFSLFLSLCVSLSGIPDTSIGCSNLAYCS